MVLFQAPGLINTADIDQGLEFYPLDITQAATAAAGTTAADGVLHKRHIHGRTGLLVPNRGP